MTLRHRIRSLLRSSGFDVVRYPAPDFDEDFLETLEAVRPYTLASPERIYAVCQAARYIARFRVPGAVVECGVWRGGSMMAAARTLGAVGDSERSLYLFDTFEGMPAPGHEDVRYDGISAATVLEREPRRDPTSAWCVASLDDVKTSMTKVGYPEERVHFVAGRVEATLPSRAPEPIALLRLDTDWYESTHHELVHLVPRLSPGGVLIIDDYGHWKGSRKATDEYIASTPDFGMLTRIDYTGRLAIKP